MKVMQAVVRAGKYRGHVMYLQDFAHLRSVLEKTPCFVQILEMEVETYTSLGADTVAEELIRPQQAK